MAKKYIDAEKLKAEVKRYKNKADERLKIKGRTFSEEQKDLALQNLCGNLLYFISSLQQEQPEENNLPSKRTRVNYAICKLQSFKPLREAIVLDDYVYDEGKCYRENLLNYIHAIPENRLKEIRHYLQEKGWWPYDDDADWMEQEQPEVDLEKFAEKIKTFQGRYKHPEIVSIKGATAFMARMFYQYPNVARQWYEQLPKATIDNATKEESK